MSTARHAIALLKSYLEGEEQKFFSVALQMAAHEARQGHTKVAQDIQNLINQAQERKEVIERKASPVPLVQPKGELTNLVSVCYCDTRLIDMVLLPVIEKKLQRILIEHIKRDRLAEYNLKPRRKILLVGPPGSGKSMTAAALAGELKLPLFTVAYTGLITKYMGDTANHLKLIFDAMAVTRGVYFFDEFDAIGSQRDASNDVGEIRRVLNSCLQLLENDGRTSLLWDSRWPIRPDITFEGGNLAIDKADSVGMDVDELQLLTTYYKPNVRQFNLFGDTSAATALASHMAARIWAKNPEYWPETVRALIVHSAEWTPAMYRHLPKKASQNHKVSILLRRYGYGVPNLEKALFSSKSDLTMIFEDQLQPFLKVANKPAKTHKMNFHQLPLPMEELKKLREAEVEMRVTLSYFIQPNPGERGQQQKHSYASHGLRFAVKRCLETLADFKRRINQVEKDLAKDLGEHINGEDKTEDKDTGWFLGAKTWNRSGSINCDIWRGTAADLAERDAIAIYPVGGWWKHNLRFEEWNNIARYALIVSIRVINKAEVDIYTPIAIKVRQPVTITT
jgi:energy-coupling factor transporter ATP-binding protein EcfA2